MKKINFHAEDVIPSKPQSAKFHIIPVPFEQSVSYGQGTKNAPQTILQASSQLELFDGKSIPAEQGIYTSDFIEICRNVSDTFQNIEKAVNRTIKLDKIPIIIGGEHTISFPVVNALSKKYDDFGVIQFDAHADLRDEYEENKYSHACVSRRIYEKNIPILQIGTRSYSLEEHKFRLKNKIKYFNADFFFKKGLSDFYIPKDFPEKVYITFDVDGFDASIMPATGTPVPGGLTWFDAMFLLEKIISERECIGFDVVEFAPIKNLHAFDFTVAQLIYNIMGFISRS